MKAGELTDLISEAELEGNLGWIGQSPSDDGRLMRIVRRPAVDERESLEEGVLDSREGLVGDTWSSRASRSSDSGGPSPDRQITVMNWRIATLVAGGEERVPLAGDQLYVEFDLSLENAPPGTRLQIGSATIELTEPPHLGCAKFVKRFGDEAMRFVNSEVGRTMRLRGANAKVIGPGPIRVGDRIKKVTG